MSILSKDQLLATSDNYTEVFTINLPGRLQGDIRIRPIKDTSEMEAISTQITKIMTGRPFMPKGLKIHKYSESDINNAVYLAACIVEPDFSVDEALQLMDTIGPVARIIMVQIFKISGISQEAMQNAEEKLENDSFQVDELSRMFGISAQASKRSELEPAGIVGNLRLSEDKE